MKTDAGAVSCGRCSYARRARSGWLDLLAKRAEHPAASQRFFLTPWGARMYTIVREGPAAWLGSHRRFKSEVQSIVDALSPPPDAVVLDVPCGQGNFTAGLARAVPDGLVYGVDLSSPMLDLAAVRIRRLSAGHVVLLRGDALALPIIDASIDVVSCCGGLHLYPDVPRAILELRRVLRPGGVVAGLAFCSRPGGLLRQVEQRANRILGARSFNFDELGSEFVRAGFSHWTWRSHGRIGYFKARCA